MLYTPTSRQKVYHAGIAFIMLAAVVGSLYYEFFGDPVSNFLSGKLFPPNNGYPPCVMCWWQRIWAYSAALVAVVAWFVRDAKFGRYTLALGIIGLPFAVYHYAIQKFGIVNSASCAVDNPCNQTPVNYLGFVTIPLLSIIAFFIVILFSWLHLREERVKQVRL